MTPKTRILIKLQGKNPESEYMVFNEMMIERTGDKINIIEIDKDTGKTLRTEIASFDGDILWVSYDRLQQGLERFVLKDNVNRILYSYTVEEIIDFYKSRVYKGNFGRDIVRKVFNYAIESKSVQERRPEYILGWENGWKLPISEAKDDYMIIVYTQEEREVMERCRNMYELYSPKERIEITKKILRFVDITQIPDVYKTIIVAYCVIAPFKLFFLDRDGIFPSLLLEGTKHTGKTSFLDLFGTYFYGHYEEHMSGQTATSLARFEDTISASTFPRVIDEFNSVDTKIVEMIKEMATSKSQYKRKLSAITQFAKPKITPLAMTSNDLGDHFRDSANSSRAIILNFDVTISSEIEWINLRRELKRKKLFSLIYDYTKDWDDSDIQKLTNTAIATLIDPKEKKSWMAKGKSDADIVRNRLSRYEKNYPRITKIYEMILSGALLFEKVFGVKLNTSEVFGTLLSSRRSLLFDLVDKFYIFCEKAINFDPLIDPGAIREIFPNYLTQRLESKMTKNEGKQIVEYIFTQSNLRDFNGFLQQHGRKRYNLRELGNLVQDALEEKDIVRVGTVNFKGKGMRVIRIKDNFIFGRFKGSRIEEAKEYTMEELGGMQRKMAEEEMRRIDEVYVKKVNEALKKRTPGFEIKDLLRPDDVKDYTDKLMELMKEDEDKKRRKHEK